MLIGDPETYSPIFVDEAVSIGQVRAFVEGHVLHVDRYQRGGEYVSAFIELVDAGLTLLGLLATAKQGAAVVDGHMHAEAKAEARTWIETQSPSLPAMRLQQLVKAERTWKMNDFMHRFDLDNEQSVRLLVLLGYRRNFKQGRTTWIEDEEDQGFRSPAVRPWPLSVASEAMGAWAKHGQPGTYQCYARSWRSTRRQVRPCTPGRLKRRQASPQRTCRPHCAP